MNTKEAMKILEIDPEDDEREIKRKYHKMISLFHPDSVSEVSEEHIRRAQKINEAYRLLCQSVETGLHSRKRTAAAGKRMTQEQTRKGKAAQQQTASQEWSGERNETAFIPRNIYMHYNMELSEEEKAASAGKLFYQTARGKYLWDPEEEDFTLFLTSLRQASAELLEKTESRISGDLSAVPNLKEYRFRVQAKIFEYLSMEYVNPIQALDSMVIPETTDGKGQRIYLFKAFLAAEAGTAESRLISQLQPEEYLYPRTFQGNQIQVMNKSRQVLGYLHMDDDRLYFCIIPLLKKHAAQVKLLVRAERSCGGYNNSRCSSNIVGEKGRKYSGNQWSRSKIKKDVDFYFRVEEEEIRYNCAELNLKLEEVLSGYEKYLGKYCHKQGDFEDLFQRLSHSDFRSRFHLKEKDLQYIQEKGMDTIRSHAQDFVRTRLAPARIPNDGKQTPMRGHPVFLAQHATGCCCRGCLYKWHRIPSGIPLSKEQQEYVVDVLMEWIEREVNKKYLK